jgi:sulfhydrogenase subunit gamma (sulfur reductase)
MVATLHEIMQKNSIYVPVMARIAEIQQMTALEKLFTVELPEGISLDHTPGQFVEVSVFGVGEAPISISSSPSRSNGNFEMCVRSVGDVTRALHTLENGAYIGVRGPFGKGFPIKKFWGKDMLFIAGGLGLPPMRSLINQILDERSKFGRVIILYGVKKPDEFLFTDELETWRARTDVELNLTVDRSDDTWQGNVGVITTLIPQIKVYSPNTIAVVIGPPVMYKFVLVELLGLGLGIREGNIWLSLERRMKCGVGKCGHCQMNNIYTCQEGPCFSYAQIKHLQEAI